MLTLPDHGILKIGVDPLYACIISARFDVASVRSHACLRQLAYLIKMKCQRFSEVLIVLEFILCDYKYSSDGCTIQRSQLVHG